jgi:hypothetical protein
MKRNGKLHPKSYFDFLPPRQDFFAMTSQSAAKKSVKKTRKIARGVLLPLDVIEITFFWIDFYSKMHFDPK